MKKAALLPVALLAGLLAPALPRAQAVPQAGDWPNYGRDAGGTRYSPLDQINTKNVAQLQRAWVYHTKEPGRAFETTPIVVDNVLYFSTQNQNIVALDAETGREIWKFDPKSNNREHRGVAYWPGDRQTPPRILFGTGDGRLMALDAKTGVPIASFGNNGAVDLKTGVADKFPKAPYAITSPPAIYRDVVIVGPATQEGPTLGPSGDPRGYDVRTGQLLWRFHTVPQPGEPGHDSWGPRGWKDRSGPSQWGPATVDTARGLVFLAIGNPADSFYGADRKGTNLYANSVVALDALTGKKRWHYQVVHHDIWDYDLAAPPALVDVRRDAKVIPAVAQITKMGLLFVLDRQTGQPVWGVEERPVPKADTPGEASWPTQPFPLKPPPLARMTITKDDITRRTPEAHRFCSEWFGRLRHEGPYTPFGTTPSLLVPGTMGGGNWGGVSFDPTLGYIFVNTSSLGGTGHMVRSPEGAPMPWRNEGGYTRFIDQDGFPCQHPPWGELSAVNAATGEVAWRVPLGSYDAIEAQGVKNAGAANIGGSIATAGGLVFIGATTDSKFRAFDARTGKELWVTKLDASAMTVPITYQGRNGKQYVVIAAGGTNRLRMLAQTSDETADALIAFALPDSRPTSGASGHVTGEARVRGERFERAVTAMQRVLQAWLAHADPRTLLLPDRVPGPGSGLAAGDDSRLYTPHNSGADLYPYLILTAELTDPALYRGRMMEMLRNEIRYTTPRGSVPANLTLKTGALGEPSLFGAGEYAKDGLVTVTEYLGRSPWYSRMVDMVADAMEHAAVESRFGRLPAADSELNGDYLQVLARLASMTADPRFVEWARRIGDAYIDEVIPGSHGVLSGKWDFTAHTGDQRLRLRDHGNELIVGLVLQYANEQRWKTPRAEKWRPVIARLLDRVLESANADGLLYDEVEAATLKPLTTRLSDNWGYVYGAVYTFYQCTGETRYREAVRKVLRHLPNYRRHVWEPRPRDPQLTLGSFDGYADTIESALYLVAREPVPEALDWIESEMQVMLGMQKPDGHIEYWYGEGNFNRTAMLYALMQSRGVRPVHWQRGMRVGAVQDGARLHLTLDLPAPTAIRFDYARHRRVLNLDRNYVRLNEFPEWFVVDENALYRLSSAGGRAGEIVRLGSELIEGVMLAPGEWIVEPLARPISP